MVARDLARWNRREVAVDLDARDTAKLELHKLVDGNRAPLVEDKPGDVSESDACLRIVLGEVPRAASCDIEKLRGKNRIGFVLLGTVGVSLHEASEVFEKLCLFHSSEG